MSIFRSSYIQGCKCPKHVEAIYEDKIIVKLFASSWYISLLIYMMHGHTYIKFLRFYLRICYVQKDEPNRKNVSRIIISEFVSRSKIRQDLLLTRISHARFVTQLLHYETKRRTT